MDNKSLLEINDNKIYILSHTISTEGANAISKWLQSRMDTWDEIYIKSVHFQYKALDILLAAISCNFVNLRVFSVDSSIRDTLYYAANQKKYFISNLISKVQNLQVLDLKNVAIQSEFAIRLISSIANNDKLCRTLKVLNLSGNPIIGESPKCVKLLSSFIVNAKHLRDLYLGTCSISSDDLAVISQRIKCSKHEIESLEVLDLSDKCRFTTNGIINLLFIVSSCANIRVLKLSHRNFEEVADCKNLWIGLCGIQTLDELDLSCISGSTFNKLAQSAATTQLSMKNITKLVVQHSLKNGGHAVYHWLDVILLACPNLRYIDLQSNNMIETQLEVISNTLANKLPMLKTLILAENDLIVMRTRAIRILCDIVNSSKKRSRSDIKNKIAAIMSSNKAIPKAIAAHIINFTNGYQKSGFGINEKELFRHKKNFVY